MFTTLSRQDQPSQAVALDPVFAQGDAYCLFEGSARILIAPLAAEQLHDLLPLPNKICRDSDQATKAERAPSYQFEVH